MSLSSKHEAENLQLHLSRGRVCLTLTLSSRMRADTLRRRKRNQPNPEGIVQDLNITNQIQENDGTNLKTIHNETDEREKYSSKIVSDLIDNHVEVQRSKIKDSTSPTDAISRSDQAELYKKIINTFDNKINVTLKQKSYTEYRRKRINVELVKKQANSLLSTDSANVDKINKFDISHGAITPLKTLDALLRTNSNNYITLKNSETISPDAESTENVHLHTNKSIHDDKKAKSLKVSNNLLGGSRGLGEQDLANEGINNGRLFSPPLERKGPRIRRTIVRETKQGTDGKFLQEVCLWNADLTDGQWHTIQARR